MKRYLIKFKNILFTQIRIWHVFNLFYCSKRDDLGIVKIVKGAYFHIVAMNRCSSIIYQSMKKVYF